MKRRAERRGDMSTICGGANLQGGGKQMSKKPLSVFPVFGYNTVQGYERPHLPIGPCLVWYNLCDRKSHAYHLSPLFFCQTEEEEEEKRGAQVTADDLQESMEDPLFFSSFSSPLLAALPTLRTRRKRGQKGKKVLFSEEGPFACNCSKGRGGGADAGFFGLGVFKWNGKGKEEEAS